MIRKDSELWETRIRKTRIREKSCHGYPQRVTQMGYSWRSGLVDSLAYTPCSVPIHIANGQVVFAGGRGTVGFTPVKDRCTMCPVLSSNILHVPALNQNLLSMLTLMCDHAFDICIHLWTMEFMRNSIPLFYASVGADKVALLSGRTIVASHVSAANSNHCLPTLGDNSLAGIIT
jgi:hypothetical protein